jgi:hypothetical protein
MDGYRTKASHQVHLYRQHMIHFTSTLTRHCFQALSLEYDRLCSALLHAVDLDGVITSHRAFLIALTANVMFASKDIQQQAVNMGLMACLNAIVVFERASCSTTFSPGTTSTRRESEERIKIAGDGFKSRLQMLLPILAENGFADLGVKLDFNEVYE